MYLYAHVDRCCFYRLWRSTIPALAVYSGEYGIQYLTPQFGEMSSALVASLTSTSAGSFSGTLPFPSNFSWSLVLVPLGGTPDQMNFFTTMLNHVHFLL